MIVADEPTKGLDEVASAHVAKALFSYDKQVVFATHDTELITRAEYAIDRIHWWSTTIRLCSTVIHMRLSPFTQISSEPKYEASKA